MKAKQKLTWADEVLTISYPSINKKFVVDVEKYADEIRFSAMLHGFKQKFGDAASGKTAAEKFAEVQAIHESLLAGEWERANKPDLTPLICAAVARIKNVSLEKVQKAAEKVGEEKVREWATDKKVKAEMLKIRLERLEETADESEEVEIEIE